MKGESVSDTSVGIEGEDDDAEDRSAQASPTSLTVTAGVLGLVPHSMAMTPGGWAPELWMAMRSLANVLQVRKLRRSGQRMVCERAHSIRISTPPPARL